MPHPKHVAAAAPHTAPTHTSARAHAPAAAACLLPGAW
jgi:hypothetical protein